MIKTLKELFYICELWMILKGLLLTLWLNFMGFHTSWPHKMYKWRKKNIEVQFKPVVSINLSSVYHKTWQSKRCLLAVWSSLSRGLSMWLDSLYWQWLAWNRRANLSFFLLSLTIWPLACTGFGQPLHSPHRLLYSSLWKIDEGAEVNKGGFRRSSFTYLHLFGNSLWLLRDRSTTKCNHKEKIFWWWTLHVWAHFDVA